MDAFRVSRLLFSLSVALLLMGTVGCAASDSNSGEVAEAPSSPHADVAVDRDRTEAVAEGEVAGGNGASASWTGSYVDTYGQEHRLTDPVVGSPAMQWRWNVPEGGQVSHVYGFTSALVARISELNGSRVTVLNDAGQVTGSIKESVEGIYPSPAGDEIFAAWLPDLDFGTGTTITYSVQDGRLLELWRAEGSVAGVVDAGVLVQVPAGQVNLVPWDISSPLWSVKADNVTAVAGRIFSQTGTTIALLDALTGQRLWEYTSEFASPSVVTTIAVAKSRVALLIQGVLIWLDATDGTEIDRTLQGERFSMNWVGKDQLVLTPSFMTGPGVAYAFDGDTKVVGTVNVDDPNISAAVVAAVNDDGYLAYNGAVYAPDLTEVGHYGSESTWFLPLTNGAYVYGEGAAAGSDSISLFDPASGATTWTIQTQLANLQVEPGLDGLIASGSTADNPQRVAVIEFWK